MSVRVLSRVLGHFHEDSDVGDRLVLIVLADAAHDDGITWISQDDLAWKCRLSVRHVRRCLRELEARGEVETRKAQRGRRRIAVYRVSCAPAEPEYDRLPFDLAEPFATGHPVPSSERDDRTSTTMTTGLPRSDSAIVPSIGPVSEPSVELVVEDDDVPDVPELLKIDGRNLGFDALAEECGVDPSGNRGGTVAAALNGSKAKGIPVGIRELVWRILSDEVDPGEEFEQAVADAIRARADDYRARMGDALLTPTALAKWWTDLDAQERPAAPATKFGRRDVSAGELLALADRLERGEIESATG